MKFKCQNCNWKFQKEIKNLDERKQVLCPECFSKIVRFAGAGFYPEQELIKQKEEKVKQEKQKEYMEAQELIDMIEHKNKLIDERLRIW